MHPLILVLLLFAALIASLFGQGGGVLFTPIQVASGVPFHQAAATSLFLIMMVSLSATLVFRRAHEVNWRMALALEVPTVLGAFLGGIGAHWISERALLFLLAGLLFIASYFLIRPPVHRSRALRAQASPLVWRFAWNGDAYQLDLVQMVPVMLVIGVLTSMTGIGGGILKVPAIVLLFGIPAEVAIGSSAFMVGITAAAGLVGHASMGDWNWRYSVLLAIPVLVGAQVGSRLSLRLGAAHLTRWFGAFLLLVAFYTVLQAARRM